MWLTGHPDSISLSSAGLSIQSIQNLCLVHTPIILSLSIQKHQVFGESYLMVRAFLCHDVGIQVPFHGGRKGVGFKGGQGDFNTVSFLNIDNFILNCGEWIQIWNKKES